jgi:hypothetical protein
MTLGGPTATAVIVTSVSPATCCLEGRFRQGVNLRVSRSEAVRHARARPLVTAVSRPFWHESGTSCHYKDCADARLELGHVLIAFLAIVIAAASRH